MAESRELGEREKALAADADRLGDEIRGLLLATPNLPSDDAPDGAGEADNVVLRTEGYDPARLRRAPAGPALGHRRRARPARLRPGHQDLGLDVRHVPGLGRPAAAGHGAAQPRPQRRRLRGGAAADPGAHRHDGARPGTCPSSPTRPTTSSATTCGPSPPPRCRSRRCTATRSSTAPTCRCATRPTRRASGARRASAGKDTRGLLRVHEFDKVELLAVAADAEQAIACQEDVLARSEALLRDLGPRLPGRSTCARATSATRPPAPGTSRPTPPASTSGSRCRRCRGSATTRPGGPTSATARPSRPRRQARQAQGHRGRPHGQRLGHGLAPHGRRLPRDPPPARRPVAIVEALRPYLGGADAIPAPTAPRRHGGRGWSRATRVEPRRGNRCGRRIASDPRHRRFRRAVRRSAQRPDRAKCWGDSSKPCSSRSRRPGRRGRRRHLDHRPARRAHRVVVRPVDVVEVERRRPVAQVHVGDDAHLLQPVERAVDGGAVDLGVAAVAPATRATISSAVTWWSPASSASTTARRDAVTPVAVRPQQRQDLVSRRGTRRSPRRDTVVGVRRQPLRSPGDGARPGKVGHRHATRLGLDGPQLRQARRASSAWSAWRSRWCSGSASPSSTSPPARTRT